MGDSLHHYQEPMIRRSLESCQKAANRRAMDDRISILAFVVALIATVSLAATVTLWLSGFWR